VDGDAIAVLTSAFALASLYAVHADAHSAALNLCCVGSICSTTNHASSSGRFRSCLASQPNEGFARWKHASSLSVPIRNGTSHATSGTTIFCRRNTPNFLSSMAAAAATPSDLAAAASDLGVRRMEGPYAPVILGRCFPKSCVPAVGKEIVDSRMPGSHVFWIQDQKWLGDLRLCVFDVCVLQGKNHHHHHETRTICSYGHTHTHTRPEMAWAYAFVCVRVCLVCVCCKARIIIIIVRHVQCVHTDIHTRIHDLKRLGHLCLCVCVWCVCVC
jgi:hypothetical protein